MTEEATADIGAATRYALAREVCPGLDVLDIGAGAGDGARLLSAWGARSVTMVDVVAHPAPAVRGVRAVRADAGEPQALDDLGTFDLVLALGVVEEADDPAGLLATVRRRMARGGAAIVTCPAEDGGPAAAARAFSRLVAGPLGRPSQVLFTLPAAGLLVIDPERAAADTSRPAGIAGQEEIHSAARVGDLRPALRSATMVVGVWGTRLPESCVLAPVAPAPAAPAAEPPRRRGLLDRLLRR